MTATMALVRALFRTYTRNRQGLFWSLFFPVVLMVIFGGLLGNSKAVSINLAVAGGTPAFRQEISSALARSTIFKVKQMTPAQARAAVRAGNEDAELLLPAAPTPGQPAAITLYYNNANQASGQETVGAVQQAIGAINLALSGRPPALTVSPEPVSGSRTFSYLAFLLPGLIALTIMQGCLFGLATGLTRWKEQGVLRRFLATPLRPVQFLGATVINYSLTNLVSVVIIAFIGIDLLHAQVQLPVAPLLLAVVLGLAAFISIGFLIAGQAKSQEAVVPLVNLISFPMMILSGVFFSPGSLPPALASVVSFFPLTYLANALRGLMSGQLAGLAPALWGDLAGLAAWTAVAALIAGRIWRWE